MASRLETYERRYRALAAQLSDVGFISPGSLVTRTTSCGKPGCRCQADPPRRHGPYYQWTWKRNAKTVTVNLSASQAKTYQKAIDNHRKLEEILQEMRELSLAILDKTTRGVRKRKRNE